MSDVIRVLVAVGAAGVSAGACGQSSRATYELTFESLWSQARQGNAYLPSAHFSPLIGGVHSDQVSFWEPGGLASEGIERMAETGSRNQLRNEVNAAIDAGTAESRVLGSRIDDFPESTTVTFEASATSGVSHDRLTLVTMVAPSPDWFVGTHGLPLRDAQGDWIDEIVVDLDVYDAGTDSGVELTSPDADTNPQEPIRNIQNESPFNGVPVLGRFTLRLVGIDECTADVNGDGLLTPADFTSWIAAFNASDPAADQNADSLVTPADFTAWVLNFNAGC
ncbi:MAG: spondin domain-containing protein [Planctomycetota bacterium]